MPTADEILGPVSADEMLSGQQPVTADELLIGHTPQERMQGIAPLIAGGRSSPQDEADYKSAYRDYYINNTVDSRLGNFLSSVHPSEWIGAIGDMGKSVAQWHQDINSQPDTLANVAGSIPRIAKGALAGVKDLAFSGLNLASGATEQLMDAVGEMKHDPSLIDEGADLAVRRLKLQQIAAQNTANPYETSAERAQFEGGRLVGSLAVPAPTIPGLQKAAQLGGDVIEGAANKSIGAAMKAAPYVGNTALAGAAAAGLVHAPLETLTTAAGGALLGHDTFAKGMAVKNGLFKVLNATGDEVMATPTGKSMIDHLADQSDQILQKAQQAKLGTSLEVASLQAQLEDAAKNNLPQGKIKSALAKAQQTDRAVEIQQSILDRGADAAKWLQQFGASRMPSKLADALSGAVQGMTLATAASGMIGQPGEAPNPQAGASGFMGGTFLGLLGSSAMMAAKEEPSALRKFADREAIYPVPLKGEPIDTESLAKHLNNTSAALIDQTNQETGKAGKIKMEKAIGSGKYDFPFPADETLQTLALQSQPVKSSLFDRISYDPKTQTGLFRVLPGKGGKNGVRSYAIPGMTPEKYEAFVNGVNQEGSMGKYFNAYIKPFENHLRIYDNLWGQENEVPSPHEILPTETTQPEPK